MSEAHEVLSDPGRRDDYDKYGKDGKRLPSYDVAMGNGSVVVGVEYYLQVPVWIQCGQFYFSANLFPHRSDMWHVLSCMNIVW